MTDAAGETDGPAFLPQVVRRNLTGVEPLAGAGEKTVLDYWRWAHGDVLENVERGVFAEFLVAAALGITGLPRVSWTGYDLEYGDAKIEVKSSAYLQAWLQRSLSKIVFNIGARQQPDESGGAYGSDPRYVADCFVFCVFTDTDVRNVDILDTARWIFYVVAISDLIASCKTCKTVSETRLKAMTTSVRYADLKSRIDDALRGVRFAPVASAVPTSADAIDVHPKGKAVRTYLVTERKTRAHPVVVNARDYQEAQLLARADETIASFGTRVSAFALSKPQLEVAIAAGAVDLRFVRTPEYDN